ncbi:unnamed protein product [Parascedosporium putredinis]|uniref:SURF6-domain-containing protein n=1 Tax=Parascedosporium putredinis TaxID=1442378 RepID=A0A9P1H287_9PEZI|nr:unnamed protein product [Parascedosporium putredinis]CAI7994699.1 unnamed protein product [Parascedosporium putredinis]
MAPSALQARLAEDENAFSGLLSLIPTRMHYADDDEPQAKKAARAAQAELDPEAAINGEHLTSTTEKEGNKRKLEEGVKGDSASTVAEDAVMEPTPAPTKGDQAPEAVQADVESSTSSEPQSPTFDAPDALIQAPSQTEAASTTTSVSSAVPPSDKPKHIKIPEDTSVFRERFAERLAALRAARKADGPDGKPVRTRQELLEQRRQKQAQRKEHKKEMRRVTKLEEDRKREEALKANSLRYVLNREHKKGPSDPKTALLKVQNEKKRLAALDPEKRKEIEEKETWLTARRRAEGEKIRDDETLLKKAVKRQDRTKRKSEKEWKERKHAVDSGIRARQKKREENIRKRKDDKKLGKMGKKKSGPTKKKNRPGFEGRFGGGGKK